MHGAANGHVPLCCRAEAGGVLAGILSAASLASTGCRARSPRAARAAARRRDHPPRRPPPQAPHPRGTRASRLPETALPPQYAPLGRSGRAAAAAAHGRRPPPQPQRLPHRPALARGRAAAAVAPARQRPRGAASGQPPCRSGSRRWRKALPSRRGRATARPPPPPPAPPQRGARGRQRSGRQQQCCWSWSWPRHCRHRNGRRVQWQQGAGRAGEGSGDVFHRSVPPRER